MAVNGLTSSTNANLTQVQASYESVSITAEITQAKVTATGSNSAAAIYEKGDDTAASQSVREYKVDQETIDRLKADAEERHASLRGLVEKLLLKQGGTLDLSKGLANVYRSLEVDEETQKQAQADIAEDGYWGIEQTSDRILDFAKALAGDNLDFAKDMLEAIKEGFKLAGEDWGEDLPDISQKTMEATYSKVNAWIESLSGSSSESGQGTAVSASATSIRISATYTKASVSASRTSVSQTAPKPAPQQEAEPVPDQAAQAQN
ncbi:MAG: hypothetical protein K6G81_01495 [Lachnospiraceae bacterium]|nr:hypothetical protein [Lachnospiraceae bacterium]